MYISQLVINGFKTFSSKTELEFGDGITAVVGPNGCGKTNIVDAIRWVLGEQKYSALRSTRMEDVIFNGAKGTKPLSMCEVYLTVKNDKGKLPIEYADVEIGRRIYRDGESDYFINRTSCRLKDITNLFVDTGMGADSYSVIELKMIEQILSETDYDRKFLFEEAAGINKYKTQRRLSIKKFEATKFDLERIDDIINEVDTKVKGLNLQLKRFKRHAILVESLKSNSIDLSTLQINKYLLASEPLRKKIDEFSHMRKAKISNQDFNEAKLSKLRGQYDEQVAEINLIRSNISKKNENREDARQKILIWEEKNRSAEESIERLKRETASNKSRIETYKKSIAQKVKELDKITPIIDKKLSIFKLEQEKFDKIENLYKKKKKIVDDIQSERWELQKKMSETKSRSISTESSIKERLLLKDRLNQRISSEIETVEKLIIDEKSFTDDNTAAINKSHQLSENKEKIEEELNILNQSINNAKIEKQSQIARLESLSAQLHFYQDLMVSQADMPGGAKYVIDNKIKSKSIMGIIANIFTTNKEYEVAINTALGDFTHCLVCENRVSALQILNNNQVQKAGKLSLIPFDEISKSKIKLSAVPNNNLIIGRASDLLKSESKYKPIADILLGNTLIVKDLSKAILDATLSGWVLVDLKGMTFGKNLILRNPGSGKGTVIGRKEKIESLKTIINKIELNISSHENEIFSLNENKNTIDEKLIEITKAINSAKDEFERFNANYQRIKFEIESKQKSISETKNELTEINQSIIDSQNSFKSLNKEVEQSEKQLTLIQRKLDDANEKLQESRSKRDSHHQTIQDMRIELLNLENSRDNHILQQNTTENTITEIKERQSNIANEISQLEEESKKRVTDINNKEKELSVINAKLKKNKSLLELKEKTRIKKMRSCYR